jgi:hypothetical protein
MKKITNIMLSAAFILAVTLTSCGKYEDGPGFTVRSKKARLCQTWKPVKFIDGQSGTETTYTGSATYTIEKDGSYKITDGSTTITGTWEWANDKEAIKTSYTVFGITTTNTSTITRLTMKELWTKDSDGDVTQLSAQ